MTGMIILLILFLCTGYFSWGGPDKVYLFLEGHKNTMTKYPAFFDATFSKLNKYVEFGEFVRF